MVELTQSLTTFAYVGVTPVCSSPAKKMKHYTCMLVIFRQKYSEVFEGTELHSLLAVEGQQGWVSEHAKLMLSVS